MSRNIPPINERSHMSREDVKSVNWGLSDDDEFAWGDVNGKSVAVWRDTGEPVVIFGNMHYTKTLCLGHFPNVIGPITTAEEIRLCLNHGDVSKAMVKMSPPTEL